MFGQDLTVALGPLRCEFGVIALDVGHGEHQELQQVAFTPFRACDCDSGRRIDGFLQALEFLLNGSGGGLELLVRCDRSARGQAEI